VVRYFEEAATRPPKFAAATLLISAPPFPFGLALQDSEGLRVGHVPFADHGPRAPMLSHYFTTAKSLNRSGCASSR
jgi:hypothetical protein